MIPILLEAAFSPFAKVPAVKASYLCPVLFSSPGGQKKRIAHVSGVRPSKLDDNFPWRAHFAQLPSLVASEPSKLFYHFARAWVIEEEHVSHFPGPFRFRFFSLHSYPFTYHHTCQDPAGW